MATKKKENAVPEIIDNVEALEAKMKAMREAQKKFRYLHTGTGRQDLLGSCYAAEQNAYSTC